MTLPLAGIKVVEITQVFAGPLSSMLLADQGAEVIKIEGPDLDTTWSRGSFGYLAFNRNKRHICIDIASAEGRDLTYRLLQSADVMVINMRVETRKRHGLTYEDVSAVNPRLIYASITGYGEEGPEADLPGADITIQARVGDLASRRLPDRPTHTSLFHFDMATAMLVAYAVMLALWQRERTGKGDKVEANLLQSAIACEMIQLTRRIGYDDWYGVQPGGLPQTYLCSDGRYILSQHINIGVRWDALRKVLGAEELGDPRFDTQEGRAQHVPELTQILERVFATKPAAEWDAILKANGHMMSMVRTLDEVPDDPQVVANQMFIEFEQPGLGEVRMPSRPFKLRETAGEPWLRKPVPQKGEHTDTILGEIGLGADEIASLKASGIVA
jgi:crotonobetainyl-CoA:carnitine CoA-transferase CaiB-like acyl-CoA transferase